MIVAEAAETMARKAVGILEQLLGSQHPKVANELNQLALAYEGQGRWAVAESTYLRCIAINEAKAPFTKELAYNYNNLGSLYSNEKSDRFNLTQAVNYKEKALEIRRATLPANHPELADLYNNLGATYIQLTQFDKALGLLEQGYTIRKANLPATHPVQGQSQENIGRALAGLSRNQEAEAMLRSALKHHESTGGKNSEAVARVATELAKVLRANKRNKEAAALENRAKKIRG